MLVNFVLMAEGHKVTVNVDDVLAVQRHTVSGPVFLAGAFWKKPVEHAEVNMPGLEFPTIIFQVLLRQPVLEMVELDKPAVLQHDSKVSSAQSPMTWKS